MLTLQTPWCEHWQPEMIGTLLFLVVQDRVLLIEKKTGHGKGKINGPGGKWEVGESLLQCARRETLEETGLVVEPLGCAAELRFVEQDGPQWLGYVFVAKDYQGQMVETPEAKPFWCPRSDIPYQQMWADDAIWLPQVLEHGILTGQGETKPLVLDLLFTAGELVAHQTSEQSALSLAVDLPRQALA